METPLQNGVIFNKLGNFIEIGTKKKNTEQTKGNLVQERLILIKKLIKDGASNDKLFETDPSIYVRHQRWIEKEQVRVNPFKTNNNRKLNVKLFYGVPGCGKTLYAYTIDADLYALPVNTANRSLWFDGYDGEKTVLIDDFAGGIGLTELLRLIDRYQIRLPIKGSQVWFRPEVIIITTNVHPKNWYNYSTRKNSWKALTRRIHEVYDWIESFQIPNDNQDFEQMCGTKVDDNLKEDWFERGEWIDHLGQLVPYENGEPIIDIRQSTTKQQSKQIMIPICLDSDEENEYPPILFEIVNEDRDLRDDD